MPVGDLRTRLRCERVGVSRPEDLSHLAFEGEVSEICWRGGREMCTSVLRLCVGGRGCLRPMPVLCIGHQETRGEAGDMLTCADGF